MTYKKSALALSMAVLFTQPLHAEDKWYETMDVGPAWMNTFGGYYQGEKRMAAIKGLSVDLGDGWRALYDTETLRLASVYKGGIEWGGTPWTGAHGTFMTMADKNPLVVTANSSGWADGEGSLADHRKIEGFGDMPNGKFTGHYRYGHEIVMGYTINGTDVLENLSKEGSVVSRSFKFGERKSALTLLVADQKGAFKLASDATSASGSESGLEIAVVGGLKLRVDSGNTGRLLADIPAGDGELVTQIAFGKGIKPVTGSKPDFAKLTSGGPGIWTEIITTAGKVSTVKDKPYLTDIVTVPTSNPWGSNLRFGGFDFIDEDSAALSTWNGDVWVVRGLKGDWKELKWQRIAAGLFETLGVKVVGGVIYVNGRDQITKLIDLNGDGETDRFEVFNRDVYVTPNFHEFAFDLQTDKEGNFYFSKGSPVRAGGRGFDRILPHHGIIAKISPDGKKFEVVATGLRAPGGLGLGPNGEITTGENEGSWQPACKINFMKAGDGSKFFGTEPSRHSLVDAPYTEPLMFFPMDADNSGGSQVWVPENVNFGLKAGELIHLSYGQSRLYRILPVTYNGKLQAGAAKLPISLLSSAMRARFDAKGSLYVLGFRGWQTNAATENAFQRIRYNKDAVYGVPEKLEYTETGLKLTFPLKLDSELAEDVSSFSAQRWDYVRCSQYGSGEFSVDNPDKEAREKALSSESKGHRKRDDVKVLSAKLLPDGKTVEIALDGMKPSMNLKISYDLEDEEGDVLKGELHATVYGK